ncbi:Polyphenol oxidase, chloroplastic [Apostasia shenzhenica]|uniref:Polyphenol oxidase, chloroplastic n=1 Tax=Apostasia shenzhenica TaxID=1088818 RepID=A0A2I0A3U1_9ASPA|nr:Polyphenol oxidase, chloroplastic [Apostasia shenzhenica]
MAFAAALLLCALPAGSRPVSPDLNHCVDGGFTFKCCPRRSAKKIINFTPPPPYSPFRVRRPAHSLDPAAAANYSKAVAAMRALPPGHPWNFFQQSNVHCAYCSGGHRQTGANISLEFSLALTRILDHQIHGSWLFFPWHRAYLYFYERILGKLAGDPTFALPFWNWDHPAGMSIPAIYRRNSSSLYNPTRNPKALKFIDIGGCEPDASARPSLEKQRQCNLRVMHRQFAAASNSTELFLGLPYRAGGESFPGGGVLENVPHSPVHINTGSDMSRIRTAARDPLFFAHHANVDRLWAIWESIAGNGSSKAFKDPDFLNASFVFWDENMQRVRIRVRDCIDTRKQLNYHYEDVQIPWLNMTTEIERVVAGDRLRSRASASAVLGFSAVTVQVGRTAGAEGEKLVVGGIQFDRRERVWFDVYVGRAGGEALRATVRTAAGCFVNMEGGGAAGEGSAVSTELRLGITEFVEAIGAAGDDSLAVTLVPKIGGDRVTIGNIWIE